MAEGYKSIDGIDVEESIKSKLIFIPGHIKESPVINSTDLG